MRQIARESEAERAKIEGDLLKSLGREATPLDRIAAEQLAAAVVRGRRLRLAGRDDSQQRKEIAQLMRASGFRPDKPSTTKSTETMEQYLARTAAGASA